jgi:16S rRNA (guanine527-N7)-methyltransferase
MQKDIDLLIKKYNVSRETIKKLSIYRDFLLKSNEKLNLIGKTTENSIYNRHFVDSAQLFEIIGKKNDIIDVGSGAGFPGIVLKLVLIDNKININVEIIEKSKKKCNFLKELIDKLEIKIKVENTLAEKYVFKSNKDIICRAFKPLVQIFDIFYKSINKIDNMFVMKGKSYGNDLIEAERKYDFKYDKVKSITSPESYILKIRSINLITT